MSRFSSRSESASLSSNILCGIGIVVIGLACGILYLRYDPRVEDLPPVAPVEYNTAVSLPQGQEEGDEPAPTGQTEEEAQNDDAGEAGEPRDIPRDEWFMRLVNFDNLLEQDFATDVVEVVDDYYFDERAAGDLLALLDGANAAGMPLRVASASRSWENQQARYETRIDELVDEGYSEEDATAQATRENELPVASEHILSLGVDIVPEGYEDMDESILELPAYQWLVEHAHEYGFIQRYPLGRGGITGIDFEPWHFRFVGVEQATLIYESGLTLEEYMA